MTPVENQMQPVGLEIVVLQSWSPARLTGLRKETTNLYKVWHPVCATGGTSCVHGNASCDGATRVQRNRNGPVFVSVANVWRAHPHARIQFCTRCPGPCFSMSSRRESLETDIPISSHDHAINTVSWVCSDSARDSRDNRDGGRCWTRSALRTRRIWNVRKQCQKMKMTTLWWRRYNRSWKSSRSDITQLRERDVSECPEGHHLRTHWLVLYRSTPCVAEPRRLILMFPLPCCAIWVVQVRRRAIHLVDRVGLTRCDSRRSLGHWQGGRN